MKLMGAESFNSWNEIRLATWPQNIHTTIPIQGVLLYEQRPGERPI